jgi:molecular chaperone DnaK
MPVRAGIDLGTTYSAVSWFDVLNNRVDTINLDSADGERMIRSVVFYPGPGQPPVVGEPAWNSARIAPERLVKAVKRSMGTSYKVPPVDGVEYTPQQVSAEILKVLAQDSLTFLGQPLEEVVITVPAYFGDNERAATLEAGQLAGLNVVALLSEPNAAALAFAVDKVADIVDRHLLVYDLGGGTFDVTLIHVTAAPDAAAGVGLKIEVLCKDGNMGLGGLDWDRALAEIVAEKVQQAHGIDVRDDPRNEQVLLDNCEKAKRSLSKTNLVSVVADLAGHSAEVTLSEFEDRTRDLLMTTQMLLERVLEEAQSKHGVARDQIQVMLTGGSTRMPMVKKMIEGVTGKPPLVHRNPELLVTIGAAYWAHLLQEGAGVPVLVPGPQGPETKEVTVDAQGLIEVSAYAVGVEVLRPGAQGGMQRGNAVIIPRGARYGETFEKEFRTSQDNMTEIPIVLYKGDSTTLDDCEPLVTLTLSGLPPGRPKGQPVRVHLGYDDSGIIRGRAEDVSTRKEVEIVIDRSK